MVEQKKGRIIECLSVQTRCQTSHHWHGSQAGGSEWVQRDHVVQEHACASDTGYPALQPVKAALGHLVKMDGIMTSVMKWKLLTLMCMTLCPMTVEEEV